MPNECPGDTNLPSNCDLLISFDSFDVSVLLLAPEYANALQQDRNLPKLSIIESSNCAGPQ
jgi:hypothetical protein